MTFSTRNGCKLCVFSIVDKLLCMHNFRTVSRYLPFASKFVVLFPKAQHVLFAIIRNGEYTYIYTYLYAVRIVSVIARTAHIHHEWRKTVHQKKLNGLKHSVKESHRPEFWIKNIFPHIIFTLWAPENTFFFISNNDDKMCWDQRNCSSLPLILCYTYEKNKCNNEKSVFYIFGSYESNATIYIRESRSCHAEMQCRTLFSQHPLFNIQPLNPFFCFWCEHMYRVHAVNKENRRKRDESRVKQCIWIFGCCLLNDLTLNFN